MIWRNPVAWLGLATLLIPVLIHLLVRHRAEPRPFPSLRFVQPTRLASVRRKMISDWPLLVIRMAMLAAAVAALADPLWLSGSRRAEWNERQARAIVVDTSPSATGASASGPSATAALVEREVAGAFQAETIGTPQIADGIRRAADWLRTAPPARRELVVISDFQLGAFDAASLRDIPSHVGIRLVKTPGAPVTRTVDGQARTQRAAAGGFTLRSPRATVNASDTAVTWVGDAAAPAVEIDAIDAKVTQSEWASRNRKTGVHDITLRPLDVRLRGSEADRPLLVAAADAVLAQGVPIASAPADRGRRGATIYVADASTGDGTPFQWDAGILITQWQVDAARAIATDASLARAVARATTNPAPLTLRTEATPEAKPGSAATRPSTAATPGESATSTPGPSSSEATAKSGTASNAASDAPSPWTVVMRDAGGRPAILAAADGANGDGRILVWSRIAATDEATALLIRATLRALAGPDSFGEAEVIAVPDATLAQFQRPASEPPASEWRDIGGNDRRWLWGAALVLLIVEQFVRRRARHADGQTDRKVYEHAA